MARRHKNKQGENCKYGHKKGKKECKDKPGPKKHRR